jgi:hypothetical protein
MHVALLITAPMIHLVHESTERETKADMYNRWATHRERKDNRLRSSLQSQTLNKKEQEL